MTDGAARDADRIEPGTAVALIAMGLGVIAVANDFTALSVALPAIEEDLIVDVGTASSGGTAESDRPGDHDASRMTALYIVGGALIAVMWLGLIYVMVVEPVRLYLRRRHATPA